MLIDCPKMSLCLVNIARVKGVIYPMLEGGAELKASHKGAILLKNSPM